MEEFLELSNQVSWHDAALGACFHLGLDDDTIRCDLPNSDFPLIELINLVLFLNGSDSEVEVIPESRHPTPAGTCGAFPAHPMPRNSAYLSNGSPRLPNSKDPTFLLSSSNLLSTGSTLLWEPTESAPVWGQQSPLRSGSPQSLLRSHRVRSRAH